VGVSLIWVLPPRRGVDPPAPDRAAWGVWRWSRVPRAGRPASWWWW